MSLPIITPAEDQPLWKLMHELQALGGIRRQDFKAVPGNPRWGYQVTPELYQKWLAAGGIDITGETDTPDPEPGSEPGPDVSTEDSGGGTVADETGDSAPSADEPDASAPAQETSKAVPKKSTTKSAPRK